MTVRCVLIRVANPMHPHGRHSLGRPWAACYCPCRAPAGTGTSSLCSGPVLLLGSGHYPLCRGYNRPPETSAPCGGPGVPDASRQGSKCWGWMDFAVGGAVGPHPSDSTLGLQARIAQRCLPSTCRPVLLPELLHFRGLFDIEMCSRMSGFVPYTSGRNRSPHRRA